MESLGDDEVGQIMKRVRDSSDRRACAQVCRQWRRVEGLTRSSLRILDPLLAPQFLPNFRNLQVLEAHVEVCDRDLECIAQNCSLLRALKLNLSKWSRINNLESFSSYKQLESLGDRGVVAVANSCRNLRHVSLRWRQGVGDSGVLALARSCKNLALLDLGHCKRITDRSLEGISDLAGLEVLLLRNCTLITDVGIRYLANGATQKCLKKLDLCECDQLTDVGALLLQRLVALQELSLAECGPNITDTGGSGLSGVLKLRSLNVAWLINLGDDSLVSIANHCANLEELNLSGCDLVTGDGLRAFAGHPNLRSLTLSSCSNIHSDDVDTTASACSALQYLCLDRGLRPWMSDECIKRLEVRKVEIDWL